MVRFELSFNRASSFIEKWSRVFSTEIGLLTNFCIPMRTFMSEKNQSTEKCKQLQPWKLELDVQMTEILFSWTNVVAEIPNKDDQSEKNMFRRSSSINSNTGILVKILVFRQRNLPAINKISTFMERLDQVARNGWQAWIVAGRVNFPGHLWNNTWRNWKGWIGIGRVLELEGWIGRVG